MEIVKEGHVTTEVKLTERFECKNCGCELKAEEDEYYIEHYNPLTYNKNTITVTSTQNEHLICSCPACHKIIRRGRIDLHWNKTHVTLDGISLHKADESNTVYA